MPFVARRDGNLWSSIGGPPFTDAVTSLAVVEGNLYAADRGGGLRVLQVSSWSSEMSPTAGSAA